MGVIISPNMKRTKEMIDPQGNIINPETKQIISRNIPDYVPPATVGAIEFAPTPTSSSTNTPVTPQSIQEEIVATEAKLVELKERKKNKIQQMKKELEDLENA